MSLRTVRMMSNSKLLSIANPQFYLNFQQLPRFLHFHPLPRPLRQYMSVSYAMVARYKSCSKTCLPTLTCFKIQMNGIVGTRWKCRSCNDYDLCDKCHSLPDSHEHDMMKIEHPDDFVGRVETSVSV